MNYRGVVGGLYMEDFTVDKTELFKCCDDIEDVEWLADYIEQLVNYAKDYGYNQGYMDAKERYGG